MLTSVGVKAPTDERPKAAAVHEQVAKRIASVRFTRDKHPRKQAAKRIACAFDSLPLRVSCAIVEPGKLILSSRVFLLSLLYLFDRAAGQPIWTGGLS